MVFIQLLTVKLVYITIFYVRYKHFMISFACIIYLAETFFEEVKKAFNGH